MGNVRLMARLDIKGPNLIKGIHLEGLRVMGPPHQFSKAYYEAGIDEIIYIDVVASLYGRNNLSEMVRETARDCFIPLTVGGGIRSVEDARLLLRSGADKVAVNTAAVHEPGLIRQIANQFGSQAMVLSIEAKRVASGKWEAFTDNGRERTGIDVVEWVQKGVELGAGEILLTSIDQEGTRKGFDLDLLKSVTSKVSVPVIASGGMGELSHTVDAVQKGGVDAIAMADALHYKRFTIPEIRDFALSHGLNVREVTPEKFQ
ncbi:MAG: imidazole glycerol phosphate synthase cyclase subunit [Bdellovibrionia bacterium]